MQSEKETAALAVPMWTVETLRAHVIDKLGKLEEHLDERYQEQLRAVSTAFNSQKTAMETALIAQKTAMEAALTAQKEAVVAAFAAQKDAINAALASQKEAVTKAEVASDKRFEGVNEFRATLADQQRTLMPRSEYEANHRALIDKVDANFRTLLDKIDDSVKVLTDKINIVSAAQLAATSVKVGEKQGWQYPVAIAGIITFLLGLASLIFGWAKR